MAYISKIKTAVKIYRDSGLSTLGREFWVYLMSVSPLAPALRSFLGPLLHEKLVMWPRVGYWPHVKNPRSFNEKVVHRKIFTDRDKFSKVSDKFAVREYVKERVGSEVLNEVYHVTADPETIPYEDLPDRFVIKATHGCGWNIIVDDKENRDITEIKSQCSEWLSKIYGNNKGEYWYGQITPKIMIEERLYDEKYDIPLDFKFFVFHGEVQYIQVDFNRFSNQTRNFYDRDWEKKDFTIKYPQGSGIEKPRNLSSMIDIAESLGEGFEFVRVDLYNVNGEDIRFGEITIAPGAGHREFCPKRYDFKLGSCW